MCRLLCVTLRWQQHPERVNHMKNMTKSELSRRRLIPATRPRKAKKGPAEEGESAQADTKNEKSEGEKVDSEESAIKTEEAANPPENEHAEGSSESGGNWSSHGAQLHSYCKFLDFLGCINLAARILCWLKPSCSCNCFILVLFLNDDPFSVGPVQPARLI